MNWRVLVHLKPAVVDHRGEHVRREGRLAGLAGVTRVRAGQAYELAGGLSEKDARFLADKVLADPVTQEASVFPADHVARTDCVRATLQDAAADVVGDGAVDGAEVAVVDLADHLCPDGPGRCRPVRSVDGVHIDPDEAGGVLDWIVQAALG